MRLLSVQNALLFRFRLIIPAFWSIFFPVKKNLEIGLGLFDGTSIDEVKSIIAHEFGHFSQNSMKVGSTVYVANTVLHNLVYAEDFWDRFLDKWCMVDTRIIRFFGVLTRGLANTIKRLTFAVYKSVQKGYLKLSRYMEYDADNMACRCAGVNNFISAMCKIDVLSNKDNLYNLLMNSLMEEKKIVSDYFIGKQIMYELIPYKDLPVLQHDVRLTEPIRTYNIRSKVKIKDIWSSHPSLEDRLENAKRQYNIVDDSVEAEPSWSLIPSRISEKVSTNFTSLIRKNVEEPIFYISASQLKEWMQKEIQENFMDERLRPFFKNISEFDVDKVVDVPKESPFTEINARKIAEFVTCVEDWKILNQVKDGHVEADEIQVDGVIYSKKHLPLEKFRIELDSLHDEIINIYSAIYAYVSDKCEETKKALFRLGFVAIFYARDIRIKLLPTLFMHRDQLYNELSKATRRDEDEQEQLCTDVRAYENHLKKVISELDLEWIANTFIDKEYVNRLENYIKEVHNPRSYIDIEEINTMFQISDSLDTMVTTIENSARNLLCDITKEVLDQLETKIGGSLTI